MNVLLPLPSVTRMHYAAIVKALITVLARRGTLVPGKLAQVRKFCGLMVTESKRFFYSFLPNRNKTLCSQAASKINIFYSASG